MMKSKAAETAKAVEIRPAKNLEDARIGGSIFAKAFENDEYWQWVSKQNIL